MCLQHSALTFAKAVATSLLAQDVRSPSLPSVSCLQIYNQISQAGRSVTDDIEEGGDGRPVDRFCPVTTNVISAITTMLPGGARVEAEDFFNHSPFCLQTRG